MSGWRTAFSAPPAIEMFEMLNCTSMAIADCPEKHSSTGSRRISHSWHGHQFPSTRWPHRNPIWSKSANVRLAFALMAGLCAGCFLQTAEWRLHAADFKNDIRPILENYCWDCHADGANKGGVAFDQFKSDAEVLANHDLWWKALRNLRADLMPPPKKPQPPPEEQKRLEQWIKSAVFKEDPRNPDPGRVTVRRLNRVEYRNTIRDLMARRFRSWV
jgi:hypothetical protein